MAEPIYVARGITKRFGVVTALDGVNAASLAVMAVASAGIARSAMTGWPGVAIFVVAAVLLLRWRVNATWLVLGGAVVGLLLDVIG